MSKLKNAQSCIIDAQYLAYLIEIAADGTRDSGSRGDIGSRPHCHREAD